MLWTRARTTAGYGETWSKERGVHYAHRAAYEAVHGPLGDLTIHHLCGQRACVNVEHMQAISRRDHAGKLGHGKLDADDAAQIRRLVANGMTHRAAADRYGVSRSLVGLIATGKRWASQRT